MNNQILTDGEVVYYVVRVNGQNMSMPVSNKTVAEIEMGKLAPELQLVAEVVAVTGSGDQLLLG